MKAEGQYLKLLPVAILLLGLLATWLAWRIADGAVEDRAGLEFRLAVDTKAAAIVGRLRAYELMLRGAAGLFFASDHVSRDEFRTYLDILQVQNDFPGVQGLGYAQVLAAADLPAHEAQMRATGVAGYRLHPEGRRDTYAAIVYLEPMDERNRTALGFDMFSEPVRRAAMEHARDSGDAALSGIVQLVQEIDNDSQPGFLMYLPVYSGGRDPGTLEERRRTLVGYVYAPFRASELMQGIIQEGGALVAFELHDGPDPTAGNLLYRDHGPGTLAGRNARRDLDIAGRHWTVLFAATPEFERRAAAGSEAPAVAGAGFAISFVLFLVVLLSLRMLEERRRSAQAMHAAELKLQQAQKMETIGQLTGGIAHDFNNLLTVVIGNAEALLARRTGDDRTRRLTEMILHAAQRGADLTARLLAIARRQALLPRPTDVTALLREMEGLLQRTLGAGVEVEMVMAADLWPVLVDPAQLESAILNLCINARDAMPDGGKLQITCRNLHLERGPDGNGGLPDQRLGDYVTIAVADSGTGMNAETLARAFDPFFTTKPVGQGSGLGLSMVFGFAKQSGGHASIDSAPGAGTTVTLCLPRSAETADAPALPHRPEPIPAGSGTILLVEDDGMVRDYAAGRLQELGYAVTAVATGSEALAVLQADDGIALLFTDLVIPGGLDGRQMAKAARQLRPGLPVLFTSGQARTAAPIRLPGAPPLRLLRKPYRFDELATAIRDLLDQG
ncbi:CHASE domain-containing protein [Marinibaculum pumilum]|uniref:histidine kinase n=1 Tax=Marinibaculum pumilum TaxID=1766165 RepID=A0ABV7L7H1_9PROT